MPFRRPSMGQILAAVVMLLGIGFVTVITASITGAFVARSRTEQRQAAAPDNAEQRHEFERIHERLDRIEATLRSRT